MSDVTTDSEILTFLESQGMSDKATVLQQIEMARKREVIDNHKQKIWQGNNGMWYTHIYVGGKRRLIAKKTKEDVENAIYAGHEDGSLVCEMFEQWIENKRKYNEAQKSTLDRYTANYKRFFGDHPIRNRQIKDVTENDLEDFIKDRISTFQLTAKAYGGLRTIIIGTWTYARKQKHTTVNINTFFTELGLSRAIFTHYKKLPQDNVFTQKETAQLIEHFKTVNTNVISLGIILAFKTGLRVGELCALKPNDIDDHCIYITKTEQRYKEEDGSYIRVVRDNAKTEAGTRCVLIDDEAVEIINQIMELNPSGEYLFEINGKRCIGQSFTRKLERACNTLNIKPRSLHKCRKTYATALINNDVPESLIIAQMGHVDISTTKNYYLFDNTAKDEAIKKIAKAVSA